MDEILKKIRTMNVADLDAVMSSVGDRLDKLETKDPEARALRQAVRAAHGRMQYGRAPGSAGIREGIRQVRDGGC